MSDISVNSNTTVSTSSFSNIQSKPVQQKPAAAKADSDAAKVTGDQDDLKTKEYGPVIAKSSDGDTVRVKDKLPVEKSAAYDATSVDTTNQQEPTLPDFDIPPVSNPAEAKDTYIKTLQKEAAKSSADTDDSTASSNITSYASYTDSQLEQMYLQGDISKIDYDLEMESREAAKEERTKDTSEFTNDMTEDIAKEADMERTAYNIDMLDTGDTSDTIPVEVRMQAMLNLDNM